MSKKRLKRNNRLFYMFVSPWLIGFLFLTFGPMIYSLYLSFLDWDFLTTPHFVFLDNYKEIFTGENVFYKSLENTFLWAAFLPLGLIISIFIAILLNQKLKGIKLFRTIFYVPVIVPMVANSLLWLWLFNPEIGIINSILRFLHIPTSTWLLSETMVIPALVIMSLWQVGGGVMIFLAALQGVSKELYEAADIDGAGNIRKFWNITIPIISPAIFFQLVTGIIGALQVFTQGYIMTNGGPQNRTLFIMLYIYREAFENFNVGYASALSWVLFIIISFLSVIMFKTVGKKVYYG